ncbi:putative ubiquitin-conjugating enzyme E2 38 [Silene latifolia]|uniref:putative ubiquitin-conjugating enzyme E2 38 n=1 Tax=Silene latifolia TaxID=37657 RepID=UPI003D783946
MTTEITPEVITVEKFPQFDVVTDASDHHFYSNKAKSTLSKTGPAQQKIMQEWKLLSKDLPDSIYVRVYETRVDLIRAAIIGARGTPYHDGLFFFDIAFPSDYPARPPSVYYWSFGFRINPNLYSSGTVCLSLIHTWSGDKSERWDSNNSTILQVLLSIQALVLNERPYFNEPGYGSLSGTKLWDNKSLAYSEDAFVLSCKTMLWVLWKPLKNFEPLVKQHFIDRAEFILNACDMYRKGLVKVGMFDGVVKEGKGVVSKKFERSIDKLFGDLVGAFARNGAPIGDFVERVRKKEDNAKEEAEKGRKKSQKPGLVKKLMGIFARVVMKKKSKTSPVVVVPQDSGQVSQ